MRLALFHPWIYQRGGIERTILEQVRRSRHDWQIYTGHLDLDATFDEYRELPVQQIVPLSVVRKAGPVAAGCFRLLAYKGEWEKYDAVLVSCDGVGNLLTLRRGPTPFFCVCHTPLRIAYDPVIAGTWRAVARPSLATRAGVRLFSAVDRRAWRGYERVFAVSSEVRQRLLLHGLVPDERIEVLHPGVDTSLFTTPAEVGRYFLVPGRIKWTKNLELAIDAFLEAKRGGAGNDLRLVIAGGVEQRSQPYFDELQVRASGRTDIEFVLSPSDERLRELYAGCLAVLFPPLNEDWGLVPLEAMAAGKPVIAVNRGGPTESVINGETGFLCEPSPQAFAAGMCRLAQSEELRQAMALSARTRAHEFDWSQFAKRIDDYAETLSERQPPSGTAR